MSHSNLPKKLQPAKKALKRFAATLQSKLQNFNFSKTIKALKTNANRLLAYCSIHFILPLKRRFLTKPPSPYRRSRHYNHLYQCYSSKNQLLRKNVSAIYIDQFYGAEASTGPARPRHFHAEAGTSRGKEVAVRDEKVFPGNEGKAQEKVLCTVEDAWREVVAKSPQLRPVDERAEEFIHKFRQDMKLQKEKSLLEFEEMLARGT